MFLYNKEVQPPSLYLFQDFWVLIPSFQSLQVPNLQKKEENVSKMLLKTINKKKTYYMSSVLKN